MSALSDLYAALIGVFNIPEVKALSVLISLASLAISVWLFRRTLELLASQRRHLVIDQSRFIDDMWQKSNALILSDDRFIEKVRDMFGYRSSEEVISTYLLFLVMNPLYVSYKCMKDGVMTPHIYEVTRDNVLSNYSGDRKALVALMRRRGYSQDFVDACEDYLSSLAVSPAAARKTPSPASPTRPSAHVPSVASRPTFLPLASPGLGSHAGEGGSLSDQISVRSSRKHRKKHRNSKL